MKRMAWLAAAIAAVPLGSSVRAADRTWTGAGDGVSWADPLNWDGGATIPVDGDNISFPNVTAQTVDTVASRILGTLTFNAADAYVVNNNTLTLGGTTTQNGAGPVTINSAVATGGNAQAFGGTGAGPVTFNGLVSGAGLLTFNAGNWTLGNPGNTFTGGVTVNTGARVEGIGTVASPNALLTTGGATQFGNGGTAVAGPVTINGGTIKMTTQLGGAGGTVTGNVQVTRAIVFGANGGTLDLRNSVGGTLGGGTAVLGGHIIGGGNGGFGITTTAGGAPAVVQFNGGEFGLSNPQNARDWSTGANTVRPTSYNGTGPVRIELSNGAMYRQGTGGGGTVTVGLPLTVAGPNGADPTSGPAGTLNTGITKDVGRLATDNFTILNYAQGLFLEGGLQMALQGGTRAIDGNITLRGLASGNPAHVAFSGRGTGTGFATGFALPGATTGINALYLGQNGDDTLTIEDGAIATLDLRTRTDQSNHHSVLLDAKTVVHAGGTLRFFQSISNFTNPDTNVVSLGNVAYHQVRNTIEGQGTTGKDSAIDLYLPFDDDVATASALGGVEFTGAANLVVNGSGLGGLRVNGLARPTVLISGTNGTPDPISNADKVANLLSASRLAGLTGSGGYLTPAPQGATFAFPAGGEWGAGVAVGLKVVDSNAGGADVSLPAGTWGHNLHVDAGATLVANAVTITGGTTSGFGTIETGTGAGNGLTFGAGSTLSPGASAGELSVTGDVALAAGSNFVVELDGPAAGTGYDQLSVTGGVELGGTLTILLDFAAAQGQQFTIIDNDGSDAVVGTFSSIVQPPGGTTFTINYAGGSGNDVVLTAVVPEPAALGALGLAGAALGLRRRRRRGGA